MALLQGVHVSEYGVGGDGTEETIGRDLPWLLGCPAGRGNGVPVIWTVRSAVLRE